MKRRYICIHGHFYQPPRENPWLEEIEFQDSAYPYHDWNERITLECYSPNSASRILDAENHIIEIINNYSLISFNYGPTLLSWMEKHSPQIYQKILDADIDSQKKFSGHGSAMAQAYNHMIMPLSNPRDKLTQVLWGIEDFVHRFKRFPEGMWLPETAVDIETLEVLAEQGIKFTILAPNQAKEIRKIGDKKWLDVNGSQIDPHYPYLCNLPSGRNIVLFFYDGPIARDVAFSGLLSNGENFAKRLLGTFFINQEDPGLAHVATDGETYGHHHRYGEMALTYALYYIEQNKLANLTVYGEYLEKFPPTHEVQIIEKSSWSCAHGVERWRNDCGCCSGLNPGWHQTWRKPLREALDFLRDAVAPLYEQAMLDFVNDPWKVRNDYIKVMLNRDRDYVEGFIKSSTKRALNKDEKIRMIKLLELQRHAMYMYTSCGWFFDEISGIETTQVMRYASRVLQLSKDALNVDLEAVFVKKLEAAPSNVPDLKNGMQVYEKYVKPTVTDLLRVGAHYAVSSLFEKYAKSTDVYCYNVQNQFYERVEMGKHTLALGKSPISSRITWEENIFVFAVLHLGDHNFIGGVKEFSDERTVSKMFQEIKESFKRNDITGTIRLIEKYFENNQYSLWHLFRDEQSRILYQILDTTLEQVESSLRQINEYHYPIIQVIKQLRIPLPKVLANTVLVMLNKDLMEALGGDPIDFNKLEQLVGEVREWSLEIDKVTLGFMAKKKINMLMEDFIESPFETKYIKDIESILLILHPLYLNIDLWNIQNQYFALGKKFYHEIKDRGLKGDSRAQDWADTFVRLGEHLKVKVV